MSMDFDADCLAILARLEPLCGGRVHDGILDDDELDTLGWDSRVKPYITVSFGQPRVVNRDRSLMLDDVQPHAMNGLIRAWGASPAVCRPVIREVMRLMVGFTPGEGSSAISVFGGGDFRQKDSGGRPTKFAQQVQVEWLFNLSTEQPAAP